VLLAAFSILQSQGDKSVKTMSQKINYPEPHGACQSTGSFYESESTFIMSFIQISVQPEFLVFVSAFSRAKFSPFFPPYNPN
jgi:hypothetical protein